MKIPISSVDEKAPSLPIKPRIIIALLNSLINLCYKNHDTMRRGLWNFLTKPFLTSSNAKPINGVTTYDVTVDPSRDLWFRVYVPTATTASLPVIIYFHGGGFVYCSPHIKLYDDFCHQQPPLPLFRSVPYCISKLKVKGLVAIQPFFGGEERTESDERIIRSNLVPLELLDRFWRSWLPAGDKCNRDHKAVNISGPESADLSTLDFPSTIVFVGGFNILQDWQRRYYNWLKNAGIKVDLAEYPSSIHGFYYFTELQESHQLITDIRHFVREQENK